MKIDVDYLDGKVVIVKEGLKEYLLRLISCQKKLVNIKLISLQDFVSKLTYSYSNKTIFYVMNKYNVIYDNAKIMIDSIKYVDKGISKKTDLLLNLKTDLIENNLFEVNDMFKQYFENKDVVLIDLDYEDNFIQNLLEINLKKSNVFKINYENGNLIHNVYSFDNKEKEIAFVASKISELLSNGVNINNIKITNISSEYRFSIKKIFSLFNLPVELKITESIYGTRIVQCFLENYSNNISETIDSITKLVKDDNDSKILKNIISIINSYSWCDNYLEVKDLIINDIKNIKIPVPIYNNAIRECDFSEDYFDNDDYIFLLNFNEGSFPINYKDEDYLSDREKNIIGCSTSVEMNFKNNNRLINKIRNIKNLYISFSINNLSNKLYISSLYDPSYFNLIEDNKISFNYSDAYNKLRLVSLKDDYSKFGTISDDLLCLSSKYQSDLYCSYDNSYTKIDLSKLNKYLKGKLSLSYTSMNTYYNCSFRYYLNYILKLNKYEDNFATVVGTILHKILSECFIDDYDFDKRYDETILEINYSFDDSEYYFINKLKKELEFIILTIKTQLGFISLKKTLYEQEIVLNILDNASITFKGFIDKVLYDEYDGQNIAVIIDYKTGSQSLNINNSYYGLDMQLPVYVYLLKKSNIIKNVRIGGFYLQKILTNTKDEKAKKDSLKLMGYSNSNLDVLSKVDSSYLNSNIIKSLRMTNNGFYTYSKVLTDDNINKLSDLVEQKINDAASSILNADFSINPKEIDQVLVGCNYCKYKDICFMTKKDIVSLKSINKEEFIGGE